MHTRAEQVCALPADVQALQETRLSEPGQRLLRDSLWESGWQASWGKPQPPTRNKDAALASPWDARHGGTGILARRGFLMRASPRTTAEEKELWETGRHHGAAIALGSGRGVLHVRSLYGHTGAAQNAEAMRLNEQLLAQALAAAASLGDAPVLLMGDFNIDPSSSPVLRAALATGRWFDAAAVHAASMGKSPDLTCFASPDGTRIDIVLCNRASAAALRHVEVLADTGIPTHRPVVVHLELESFADAVWKHPQPRMFPAASSSRRAVDLGNVGSVLGGDAGQQWRVALHAWDVESLWGLWCRAAESTCLQACGDDLGGPRSTFLGRGRDCKPLKQQVAAPQGRDAAGAVGLRQRRAQRLVDRLAELKRQLQTLSSARPGAAPMQARRLWQNVQDDGRRVFSQGMLPQGWDFSDSLPTLASCDGFLLAAQQISSQLAGKQRSDRILAWKARMQQFLSGKCKDAYKWCREDDWTTTGFLQRADGTLTGNSAEIDRMVLDAWLPIFRKFADSAEPAWEPFEAKFGQHVPSCPMELGPLSGKILQDALRKLSTGASGADGWRIQELRLLPESMLEDLAEVLNCIEETGAWPRALMQAVVSLIPKGEGCQPLDQRPISVMSAVYRLWGAARVPAMSAWQETWIAAGQHAYRPGHGTEDVYWTLGLMVEEAILTDTPLHGAFMDFAKCFDSLPQGLLFRLAAEMGLSPRVLLPLQGMYDGLRRRFRLGASLGTEWTATNGILQGCPLSVFLLNALMAVWSRAVEASSPGTTALSYADDPGIIATSADALQAGVDVTVEFEQLTDQKLHASKGKSFCTEPGAAVAPTLRGVSLPLVQQLKCLGAELAVVPGPCASIKPERVASAQDRAVRTRSLPLPWELRQTVLSALVLPRALYGCAVCDLPAEKQRKLRTCVVAALWRNKVCRRCPATVLTLLAPGHRLDPQQGLIYTRLKLLQRMWLKRPDLQASIVRVWNLRVTSGLRAPGPVGLALSAASAIGWDARGVCSWTSTDGTSLRMDAMVPGLWQHTVRDHIRHMVLHAASSKRTNLRGLEAGVDRNASCKLLKTSAANQHEKHSLLRRILADSVWTASLRCRIGRASSPICPHCGLEPETLAHLWWSCPAWDVCRRAHPEAVAAFSESWPPCLALCGIQPVGLAPPIMDVQSLMVDVLAARHLAENLSMLPSAGGLRVPAVPAALGEVRGGRRRGRGRGCGRGRREVGAPPAPVGHSGPCGLAPPAPVGHSGPHAGARAAPVGQSGPHRGEGAAEDAPT
jgi:endonuclease/exonuclease/phosphatase family metal-dependent hydrolase